MKVAIFSDIHDNLPRLEVALAVARKENIKKAICLGDVSKIETLRVLADEFDVLYLALGNMDFELAKKTGLFPENIIWFPIEGGSFEIGGKGIYVVHYDFLARKAALTGLYDIVFYGHTHTPWEKKLENTILLNPGEISGQFGQASFAIYDLEKMKARLELLS